MKRESWTSEAVMDRWPNNAVHSSASKSVGYVKLHNRERQWNSAYNCIRNAFLKATVYLSVCTLNRLTAARIYLLARKILLLLKRNNAKHIINRGPVSLTKNKEEVQWFQKQGTTGSSDSESAVQAKSKQCQKKNTHRWLNHGDFISEIRFSRIIVDLLLLAKFKD